MRRARQRGDRRNDRGMQIRLGADHHARGERRSIRAVLGMQNEIAVDQLRGIGARFLAGQHPEQIGGVAERRVGGDRLLAGADARMRGDDHRHLRRQPHGLAQRRLARIVGGLRIESGERGRRRAQHVHRMRRFDGADNVEHRRRQLACRLQFGIEGRELLLVRQFAVEQQPRGFLEARMLGKIVDRIAAIAQLAGLSVDEGAGRAVEVDASEAALNLDRFVSFGH